MNKNIRYYIMSKMHEDIIEDKAREIKRQRYKNEIKC